MKKLNYLILFALAFLAATSCKKDDNSVSTTVTPVKTFFSPANDKFVDLSNTSTVLFEWDQSLAQDGGLVLYTVAFDKPDGDFSHPLYTVVSDGNGVNNKATISKATLNTIAKNAGISPLDSINLKWTVFSSKGVNAVKADSARTITVKRANGLDNPPAELYITGTATEGGDDLSKAIKLKSTGDGKFEIYTSLKSGTYHFVDKTSGSDISSFYIDGSTFREGDDVTTITGSDTKEYRIDLDLSILNAQISQIKAVDFWYCSKNDFEGTFTYKSNGVWEMDNYKVVFTDMGGWTDNRHKFRVTVNNGTADTYEWWGNSDHEGGNAPTSSSPASFYYLRAIALSDNDQWDYGFKFPDAADGKQADIQLIFSPDIANYTHSVTIH
ncbi:hypothetical protein A9P82_12695 [Arachidicoccus ginsenosidimutans]|uniref:SusE domain-containing protein n=1 Tax=Arachidicoccus sp. BS20 TaxID=1850526 RepID=UPI0007F155F2|nr:SusE domain-containing protein [Arachidicoccus sp. BS20]ANI90066.1 hypothetical protein A9P82_12695 [Arachidicoccus sp. BS20]